MKLASINTNQIIENGNMHSKDELAMIEVYSNYRSITDIKYYQYAQTSIYSQITLTNLLLLLLLFIYFHLCPIGTPNKAPMPS